MRNRSYKSWFPSDPSRERVKNLKMVPVSVNFDRNFDPIIIWHMHCEDVQDKHIQTRSAIHIYEL